MNIKKLYFVLILYFCLLPSFAFSGVNLALEVNPNPVRAGETIKASLTVVNDSDSSPSGEVELILRYPDHLYALYTSYITTGGTANTVTCNDSTYCSSGNLVTWNLGNLPPGGGVTVIMPPTVTANTADGTLIQFDAEVRVDGTQQAQVSKTAQVQADPFFELTVDEETDPVASTGTLNYTLTYGNVSTSSSNTRLVFPLPPGTSFVSATNGGTEEAGEVTWDIGSLTSGEGGEQQVTVLVNGSEADILQVDTAHLIGSDSSYNVHQVSAGRVTRVEDDERPILAMNLTPHPVKPDEQLNIELTVTNPTSSVMANVELILRYPEHLNNLYTSYITTGGSANTVICNDSGYCTAGRFVTWSLGNLPPGEGVTVSMPPTVIGNTIDGTLIQCEAEVRVDGIQQALVSKTARVQAEPFFELTVDEETDPVTSTGNCRYTLTYGNVGTSSSSTRLVFPLPTGTNFISATNGGTEANGEVTWNIGSLTRGEGGERKLTVQVKANEGDILQVDTAHLIGSDSGSVVHQVSAGRVTRVEDDERPILAMNLTPHPVQPNEQLNVELTVTNPTSSVMSNVELILRYPESLNDLYTSYITTGGSANSVTCNNSTSCSAGKLVTWSLGNLRPGGGVTVTMPPTIRNGIADGTLIQFEAEVRVDGIQQAQASKTAQVQADPFFELTVDEESDPFASTGNRQYTITYANVSTSSSNTHIVFPVPPGSSFISASDGGTEDNGEVTWNIGNLASGEGGERKLTVQINANEADILQVDTAHLIGSDSSYIVHQVNAGRVTRVEDDERPILAMNLTPHPVQPNEQLNIELTVTNSTSSVMTNVELILRYPENLNNLYTSSITTGGSANTVTCNNSTSCSTGKLVTWSLGNLPPGGDITVTMPPTVRNGITDGTLIQFDAEVRVDGTQLTLMSKTVFVGTDFSFSSYPKNPTAITCFPVRAKNGKTVIICM